MILSLFETLVLNPETLRLQTEVSVAAVEPTIAASFFKIKMRLHAYCY